MIDSNNHIEGERPTLWDVVGGAIIALGLVVASMAGPLAKAAGTPKTRALLAGASDRPEENSEQTEDDAGATLGF